MSEVSEKLTKLGFEKGSLVEIILVTRNPDETLNAAPMGVVRIDSETLEIKPYRTSSTYRNLLHHPEAGVNITSNPEVFLLTAFKDEDEASFDLIKEDLSLKGSDATLIVKIIGVRDYTEERAIFTTQVISAKVGDQTPKVFSRGKAAAIEAVIYATRIKEFLKTGFIYDAERLVKRVYECKNIIERVSGSETPEVKVINRLMKMIEDWRDASSR
ncbi:MAG: DUF447 domain-containing protein [Candidatus Bathyarchaeia archaeon]